MRLIQCNKNNYKAYLHFIKDIYKDNSGYKDSISVLLKPILTGKSEFSKHAYICPVMVYDDNKITAAATFIQADNYKDVLQIAFFEALPGYQSAVDLIIDTAKDICKERNIVNITVGLNGHVNYGLGILSDNYDLPLSFGSNYNPPYYIDYFNKYKSNEHTLVSYCGTMDSFNFNSYKRVIEKINSKFTFRNISFRNFKDDLKIYTDLNNKIFKSHPFYFKRSYEEDYELFRDLKLFLREENLIFVLKDGDPIGFMLWYPDYNQLIPEGKNIGVDTFVKNKLFSDKIDTFKIIEMGVLSEYQNTGAILGLFNQCYNYTKNKYHYYETSWILNSNFKSKNFGVKWAEEEYKHYKVYEIEV